MGGRLFVKYMLIIINKIYTLEDLKPHLEIGKP